MGLFYELQKGVYYAPKEAVFEWLHSGFTIVWGVICDWAYVLGGSLHSVFTWSGELSNGRIHCRVLYSFYNNRGGV